MPVITVMIKIDSCGMELSEVTVHLLVSQRTRQALSMSQQHWKHPRNSIIFSHNVDVNVWHWSSYLTTEIINQQQLHCTWQIAALPSVKETCFIYTAIYTSLPWGFLIVIAKGEILTRTSPRFPSGFSEQEMSPCDLHSWAITVPPSQTHLQRTSFLLR